MQAARCVLVPLHVTAQLPPRASSVQRLAGASMGTSWSVRAACAPGRLAPLAGVLQQRLDAVVAQMSHWDDDSDLARFNGAPAASWQVLPEAFFSVMEYALAVARDSGGAYDPCGGALVNLWGFGARKRYDQGGFQAPAGAAVDALLARRAAQRVELDRPGRRLLQPGGVQLDLSSVAKGYAVDQLARCLEAHGVQHYLAEIGGELRGAGMQPDGAPWWVELEGLPDAGDGGRTVIALHGMAVATSGDYRRHFDYAGRRASHTLDPRSGYPINNGVAAVSVLHAECMAADALSTALTVLGADAGLAWADQRQLAARFLLRRGARLEERCSDAWRAMTQ
ncbi:MAG: FAD:protein FMN transferase [Pseudomonadota bacterium]|nr:FAD:protein FMN transferase [Pseudomonadota bacterium]